MKNSDVKIGDTVMVKREFHFALSDPEFGPNLTIEKGSIGIVKNRQLLNFSDGNIIDENSDIIRLNIGFSIHKGIVLGIWVKAQDAQLMETPKGDIND